MRHPTVMRQKRKRGHRKKKPFSCIWAASFRLEYNKKNSKTVLLHSQCIAPPVTQGILVFFQLCSPALPWHTGPDLLGKNWLGKTVFEGFFWRANLINCRELATGWRCMRMEAESCFECQKCLFQGKQSRGFISTIFFTRRCPLA